MSDKLNGKVVLVTGGGRDIGAACALESAAAGAKVVLTYMSSATGAEAVCSEIEAAGGEALALKADLTKAADVDAVIAAVSDRFGALDVVMHVSGGLVARKTMAEMDVSFWQEVMDLNVTSLFMVCKAALPIMRDGGAIVTFASQAGRDGGGPGAAAYAASKGAVMTFTRGLAKELGPRIRVNAICPGMIDTGFHDTFTKPEVREKVAGGSALKREGVSAEVGKLAVYLASDDASYVTGANVDVNGGTYFS
ncbi:3-oxoacyl-[acyl-carrier-protein] reductase [Zhongshania aliphaticivorans]|uniref:3-oxoacyl-[acyl-carrier-protein] reductase n=1 Tax=Zhongshania aliphaticivorans TaxID=1470434 RepID=A0A5S9NJQ1_9GAMM|nr:SDR family oxidoreductase [Zhongshania aliphaticivorans]CAA0090853.1 3-oxoacyl-[acyl-carrier-protein] reductase [Zhongshania aliphaticivorans]CAA0098353.1 3-oxoacyl-[acyl-carrier-protein] reductase [Zhongshania aliphaticivorans]